MTELFPPETDNELQSQVPVHAPLPQLTATCVALPSTARLVSLPMKLMSLIVTPVPGVPIVSG